MANGAFFDEDYYDSLFAEIREIRMSERRSLSKTNYRIHTDSIKENIVPKLINKQKLFVYANEADVINEALFGMTAKE